MCVQLLISDCNLRDLQEGQLSQLVRKNPVRNKYELVVIVHSIEFL